MNNLIIPISVEAVNISNKGVNCAPKEFNFENLIGESNPFLISTISTSSFYNSETLDKGIHLHWSLPQILTRGKVADDDNQSKIKFPQIPNFWFITRIVESNGNKNYKHWVNISNYREVTRNPKSQTRYTVIFEQNDQGIKFYKLGEFYDYDLGDSEPYDAAKYSLNSMGYGSPAFASSYSNCKSVLGFHDNCEDIEDNQTLTYVVNGWYQDENLDKEFVIKNFLDANENNLSEFEGKSAEKLGLKLDGPDSKLLSLESRSIYSGCIRNIKLNTASEPPTIKNLDIVFADTHDDAIEIITVTEKCLLETIVTDEKCHEKVLSNRHLKTFAKSFGGEYYQFKSKNKGQFKENENSVQEDEYFNLQNYQEFVDLPIEMIECLRELNIQENILNKVINEKNSLQERLFCYWYMFLPTKQNRDLTKHDKYKNLIKESLKVTEKLQEKINDFTKESGTLYNLVKDISDKLSVKITELLTSLESIISEELYTRLKESNNILSDDFSTLLNSSVLLDNQSSMDDLENKIKRESEEFNKLLVNILAEQEHHQLSIDELKKLNNLRNNIDLVKVPRDNFYKPQDPVLCFNFKDENIKFAGDRNKTHNLIKPYILSDDHLNKCEVEREIDVGENIDFHNEVKYLITCAIQVNSNKIQINNWSKDSCQLHSMEWEIKCATEEKSENKNPTFIINESSNLEYKTNVDSPKINYTTYFGSMLLSDAARAQLKNINDKNNDNNKVEIQSKTLLSSTLSGLYGHYLERLYSPQLEIYDKDQITIAEEVKNALQDFRPKYNPNQDIFDNLFQPTYYGSKISLENLKITDIFGRIHKQQTNSIKYYDNPKEKSATLPIRIIQDSRINFKFLSSDAESKMNEDKFKIDLNKETTFNIADNPICGWVITNNFNNSLMIYDQEGQLLCSLRKSVDGESVEQDTSHLASARKIDNSTLNHFVESIKTAVSLEQTRKAINHVLDKIKPIESPFANIVLSGIPLAIVNATLTLELKGLPAINTKDLDEEVADITHTGDKFVNKLTRMNFPLKLGDENDIQDGLVGFYSREQDGSFSKINTVGSLTNISPTYYAHKNDEWDGDPVIHGQVPLLFTLLLDPRGKIGIKSGILPYQTHKISEALYRKVLEQISISFFISSVITDTNDSEEILIPTSKENNLEWTWLEKESSNSQNPIKESNVSEIFEDTLFQNKLQIRDGWLKLKQLKKNNSKSRKSF